MTEPQLPPVRRRALPPLPDPMSPSGPPAPEAAPSAIPSDRASSAAPPQPALGVTSTMPLSVRTSAEVRAMFDALAADDAETNRARMNNRDTLDRIITDAYNARFGSRW